MLTVFCLSGSAIWRARATRVVAASEANACFLLLAALACWVVTSSILAARGAYIDPLALRFLPLLIGFLVPSALVAVSLWRSDKLRAATVKLILWLPLGGLIAVQALRITALGTIAKYVNGELPGHFILPVGVPDFLVGLSAVPLALWVAPQAASWRGLLIAWNLVGTLIFVYAGFALHFSLPTPIQLFTSGPTTEAVFRFPLALVPTFLVPFFCGVHAAVLWRLVVRTSRGTLEK